MYVLELAVPVKLCLGVQRLACQDGELAGEVQEELLCHKCAVNVGLVEKLYSLDNPVSRVVHSHWSYTHVLYR